jgi:hypothetical protein
MQAATLLVPKAQHDANPFFSNAARHLMYAALLALIVKAPGRWTLRHCMLVLRSESLLRRVLDQTEFTAICSNTANMRAHFRTSSRRSSPPGSLRNHRRRLGWRGTQTQSAGLAESGVHPGPGHDEDNRAAIDTINQLLFKRLSEWCSPRRTAGGQPAHDLVPPR